MSELRECPFCGSNNISLDDDGDDWYIFTCLFCNAKYESSCDEFSEEAKEEAIEEWNARPAEDFLLARSEKAESELAALREQTRWIPVEERLPDSGVDVLTCSIGYQDVSEYSLSQDKKSWRNAVGWPYALESVTHWMQLPPSPEVK